MFDKNGDKTIITPSVGSNFWDDHAGLLIQRPEIAIVELVANSWDAGADQVMIDWPNTIGGSICVKDNGIGMSYDEFVNRWSQLNYNRIEGGQGIDVKFPLSTKATKRRAFGKNGKGRHSMFCFCFDYFIETWQNNKGNKFHVQQQSGRKQHPFIIQHEEEFEREGSGTLICGSMLNHFIKLEDLRALIGTKFVAETSFNIFINNERIELEDLHEAIEEEHNLSIPPYGVVKILLIDSQSKGRTSKQHGVAWWVNKRNVGIPSWEGVDIGKYLDARTSQAKRYTFVVLADIMEDQVKADWSWFIDSQKTRKIVDSVNEKVQQIISSLFDDVRRSRKETVLRANKDKITELPQTSLKRLGDFVDILQVTHPSISERDLSYAIGAFTNVELSRNGYKLLHQLAEMTPSDVDALSDLLDKWSITEATIVLNELERRLRLIKQLEQVVETYSDELHQIHPLIENGLWIFGPQYETVEFTSNKTLSTVIKSLLKGNDTNVDLIDNSTLRPDLVVLPDESVLRLFSRDSYDKNDSEVIGVAEVLIVELKKGNFTITSDEVYQAQKYAQSLIKSGKISASTQIRVFVLGTKVDLDAQEPVQKGQTFLAAVPYGVILKRAHARTFKLIEKLESHTGRALFDREINRVMQEQTQQDFFKTMDTDD